MEATGCTVTTCLHDSMLDRANILLAYSKLKNSTNCFVDMASRQALPKATTNTEGEGAITQTFKDAFAAAEADLSEQVGLRQLCHPAQT